MPGFEIIKSKQRLRKKEKLDWEKELLGIYISDHPLKEYSGILEKEGAIKCSELLEHLDDKEVKVGGVITSVLKKYTRNKEAMLFIRLEDMVSSVELIVFPKTLQKYPTRFREGNIVVVQGNINTKDNEPKVLVDSIRELALEQKTYETAPTDDIVIREADSIKIYVPKGVGQQKLELLKEILAKNKGDIETFVFIPNGEETKKVKLPFGTNFQEDMVQEIENLFKREIGVS